MEEDGRPRGSWKMARIKSLIVSESDGIARAATLVSSSGKLFKRPYRLLYPLEMTNHNDEICNDAHSLGEVDEDISDRRPNMRMAAIKAKERIRNIATNSLDGNVNNGIIEI